MSKSSETSIRWINKMLKQGKCICCGKKRDGKSKRHCNRCLKKVRLYHRKRNGFKAWRLGGPGRPPVEVKK